MDFDVARKQMVKQQCRTWHVLNPKVVEVLSTIPREAFVPKKFMNTAYADTSIPLNSNQSMPSPCVAGRILEELQLKPSDRILEIGTGTGYLTALLASLCKHVYSLESDEKLYSIAVENCVGGLLDHKSHNITIAMNHGEQTNLANVQVGWPLHAPYDVILINTPMKKYPSALKMQLAPKGRLMGFIECGAYTRACIYTNRANPLDTAKGHKSVVKKSQIRYLFELQTQNGIQTGIHDEFEF